MSRLRKHLSRYPVWVLVAAFATLVTVLAYRWVGPGLPQQVVIAAGRQGGAYYRYAEAIRDILAEQGIEVVVRETAGSEQNLTLLRDHDGDVSLALVQGGLGTDADRARLQSLASLYPEPIWLFHRNSIRVEHLTDLEGRRVSVGERGSGTRTLALKLLAENGLVGRDRCLVSVAQWKMDDSANALLEGRLDACFFVQSGHSAVIQRLLVDPEIQLFQFPRPLAYVLRHPYLSQIVLPEGGLRLSQNEPPHDIGMLAADANLVARADLHPALVPLLVDAAQLVQKPSGMFATSRTYPATEGVSFPLHPDSRRFFQSGPSLLFRIFPFRVAVWMDRMKVMIIPLVTLLLPLLKTAPPIYRWTIRFRIYRWYGELHDLHSKITFKESDDLEDEWRAARRLEQELMHVRVPLSYMQEYYALQLHLAHVIERLRDVDRAQASVHQVRRAA